MKRLFPAAALAPKFAPASVLALAGLLASPAQAADPLDPAAQAAQSAQSAQSAPPVEAPADAATPRVVVQSRRLPQQGSRRSLTGAEAAQVPGAGSDAIRALQALPGVVTANDASGEPAVRGSRPADNAAEIDFLPAGYLFHAGGLVSVLPGELVKRFDLHSAAFGPQFADVTGAVLDVSLRDPRVDRRAAQFDVSFLSAGFIVEGPVSDQVSLLLAARRSHLDLVVDEVSDEDTGVIVQLPVYSDYQFKGVWQLNEAQRLSLHLNGAKDSIRFRVPDDSLVAGQEPVLAGNSHEDSAYATQALQWEADLGASADHRMALGHTQRRIDSVLGTAMDLGARADTVFWRDTLHWRWAPQHELWAGAALQQTRVKLDLDLRNARCTEFEADCDLSNAEVERVRQQFNARDQALHLRERWQFQPDWALNLGVRLSDDQYLDQRHTEPRLGLEWAASPRTTFSAGWGRHHQSPDDAQIIAGIGNPSLRHLQARHSVLGVRQLLDAGWNWQLEVYDKAISQLVIADATQNYVNGGSGQAQGAELLLRKEPEGSAWSGWLSLSWARSTRHNDATGEAFRFEYDQPLVVNLVGRWQRDARWAYGARLGVHSGSLFTPVVGTRLDEQGRIRPVYGALNSERLPTYYRLDLRADYRVSDSLNLYGELINATNHRNISGYLYNADYSSRKAQAQLPLFISLGAQFRF